MGVPASEENTSSSLVSQLGGSHPGGRGALVAKRQEHAPEFPAHVNSTGFCVLRRQHCARPAAVIVALDNDVAIRVALISPEMQIAPLKSRQLSLAQAGA